MELLERDQVDHPDFDQLLPRIGCGVCGRHVQTLPADRKEVRRAYQAAPDDEDALQARVRFEGPMAAWSREHAKTHSQDEHNAADGQRLRE